MVIRRRRSWIWERLTQSGFTQSGFDHVTPAEISSHRGQTQPTPVKTLFSLAVQTEKYYLPTAIAFFVGVEKHDTQPARISFTLLMNYMNMYY